MSLAEIGEVFRAGSDLAGTAPPKGYFVDRRRQARDFVAHNSELGERGHVSEAEITEAARKRVVRVMGNGVVGYANPRFQPEQQDVDGVEDPYRD